jgi:ABC-type cobalt transport system substrate-binding protein
MMTRPNNKKIRSLPPIAAMVIAVAIGLVRTEKTWAEAFGGLDFQPTQVSMVNDHPEPFDPRRVPPSGGMASRLLAGIIVTHARSELSSLFN